MMYSLLLSGIVLGRSIITWTMMVKVLLVFDPSVTLSPVRVSRNKRMMNLCSGM
jgi:hypothetical protein